MPLVKRGVRPGKAGGSSGFFITNGWSFMPGPFFFLHIPRTAGTTFNAILADNFSAAETLTIYKKEDYKRYRFRTPEELAGIRLINGHVLLESTAPPTFYGQPVRAFTFLRDPVARLISEYDFLRSWPSHHLYATMRRKAVSFSEYLTSTDPKLFYRGKNFMTRCIANADVGSDPYPEEALARAKEVLARHFGCFGIQERFTESLVLLGEYLGLDNLLHEKRNARKPEARTQLSEEEKKLVRELNRADCELYAFAADLFARRVAERGQNFTNAVRTLEMLNAKFQKVSALLRQRAGVPDRGAIDFPKDGLW